MGGGASAGLKAALGQASDADLKGVLSNINESHRQRLLDALAKASNCGEHDSGNKINLAGCMAVPMPVRVVLDALDTRTLIVGYSDAKGDALVDYSIFESVPDQALATLLDMTAADAAGGYIADRCRAAMLGMAMGDAAGAALEFMPAVDEPGSGACSFSVDEPTWFTGSPDNAHNVKPGQWTDDTSMGLCLADSLIMQRGFTGSDFNTRLWCWYKCGYNNSFRHETDMSRGGEHAAFYIEAMIPIRESIGAGGGMKKALESLAPDEPAPANIDNGVPEDGNASLIRLAPVPVFCAHKPVTACVELAHASCTATTCGREVTKATEFMAYTMHRALTRPEDSSISIRDFLDDIAATYSASLNPEDQSPGVSKLRRLLAAVEAAESTELCWNWRDSKLRILQTLQNRGERYNGHPVSQRYFGSYAMDGIAVALWALYNTSSGTQAVTAAANLLGDADSTACIAGQIAGAFYGCATFDAQYVEQIRRWDPRAEIELRASLLMELGRESYAS